jgi:hypothetical protein
MRKAIVSGLPCVALLALALASGCRSHDKHSGGCPSCGSTSGVVSKVPTTTTTMPTVTTPAPVITTGGPSATTPGAMPSMAPMPR